ncbi:putative mannitol dehydrogenase [Neoconidiobolus thromboides FSU 785]|nr:putative mannitol dehydrogenase [Neoconidiobolus thromboides FSU 785]
MSNTGKYNKISGYACHGKDEKLVKYTYDAAPLQPNDVEIKISHCGICGSDLHTMDSGWGPTNYPVIVGHEIVGEITAVGDKVQKLKVGDRVGVGAQCAACMNDDCYACKRQREVFCKKSGLTYNSKRDIDGSTTYGGYAEAVHVQEDFCFLIPESIPSDYAAPLLCAGATVFTPMLHNGFKSGDKVGVIGIGGLGHLAIQFANAMGCEVYALSHSHSKENDAKKMGAKHFIAYSNEEEADKIKDTLKYLIVTSNANDSQWDTFANWMDIDGKIILLAVPESNVTLRPFTLIMKNIFIGGSAIGSPCEIRKMLDFAAEHKVYPWIENYPMDKCNEGVQLVRDGKVRYRVVLNN